MMMRLDRSTIIWNDGQTKSCQAAIGPSFDQSAYDKCGNCEYCMTGMTAVL
jgi:hypothetical protein